MRNPDAWQKRKRAEPSATVRLDDAVEMPVGAGVAWAYLQDIKAVAGCIPGLVPDSIEQLSDTTFRGTLKHLALGVPSTWKLTAQVQRSDPDRTLAIHLDGVEERLDLKLAGDATLAIVDADPARLDYTGDLTVRGRLAGAGAPIIERVIGSIIERFVQSVGAAGELAAHRSWWRRLIDRIRSLFRA